MCELIAFICIECKELNYYRESENYGFFYTPEGKEVPKDDLRCDHRRCLGKLKLPSEA